MKDIKFRGICEDTRVWVYGYVFKTHKANPRLNETTWIFNEDGKFKVASVGVGQYTDLKDKNGIEIYDGDILYIPLWNLVHKNPHASVKWQENFKIECFHDDNDNSNTYVDCFIVESENKVKMTLRECICSIHQHSYIVGNIYENHELLE